MSMPPMQMKMQLKKKTLSHRWAWDPDFTKLTPKEQKHLEAAENGEYIDSEDIDWSN